MNYQKNIIEVKSTHCSKWKTIKPLLSRILFREHSTNMRYLLPILLVIGMYLPNNLFASHIVGGEISYKCLGNNQYEITLDVYRDCFFGSPNAPFDDPASIGIFNQDGNLIQQLLVPFIEDDTLDAILFDECLFIPEEVCVHTTSYVGYVILRFLAGGYQFVYQRCCINQTIAIIVNPDETGATYDIFLTEEAMTEFNTSPKFKEWPPIFICVNNPIFFDHSAEEPDNDSLVYRLCTPSSGASFGNPRPQPPNNPPYDPVVWVDPTFSLENLLGLGTPLAINPTTGLITGMPMLQGQFVVGICVDEYDRTTGNMVSSTRRDFQYNVGQCGTVIASVNVPDAQCENLDVALENTSDNANDFQWYFDWPNNTLSSTTAADNFTFTYPGPGEYTIALIAEPLSTCADTSFYQIVLQDNSLTTDFQIDVFDCDTEATVQLVDLSTETVSSITQWSWTLNYDGNTLTSNEQNPTFTVPLFVTGTINLTATTENGCIQSNIQPFQTGLDNPGSFIVPQFEACVGETIALNPNTPTDIGFNYQWSPTDGLDDANAINPTITVSNTITYTVTITPQNAICETIREVKVDAVQLPQLSFETTSECGGMTINFNNTSLNASAYEWDFGDNNSSSEINPSHSYNTAGTYTIKLRTADGEFCQDSITQEITITEMQLSAAFSANYDNCSETSVAIQFNDNSINNMNNTVAWNWTFSNGATSDQREPLLTLTADQTLEATLEITTADGCTNSTTQSFEIDILDGIDMPDMLQACIGSSVTLTTSSDPDYTYAWSPTEGVSDPTSPNPTFNPATTTTYTVTITTTGLDVCEITREVEVFVTPAINLQVNGNATSCESSTTLTAVSDVDATITWLDSNGVPLLINNPEFTVDISGSTTYMAQATDQYGCTETQEITVSGGTVDVAVPDQIAVCLGEEVVITVNNLDANDILTYSWSPANVFVSGTENTATPDFIETVGEQMVYVTISNQAGCEYQDSVLAVVVDPDIQLSFDSEIECNGATVAFTNTSTDAFGYIWNFGDGTTSTEENPTHTYNTMGSYDVTLSIIYDVNCVQNTSTTVDVMNPQIIAAFEQNIMDCEGSSTDVAFTDVSINSFNNTVAWDWQFSNGITSDEQNPMITISENGDLIVTLTITSGNNCQASVTDTLSFQLIDINLVDELTICEGDSTSLNPGGNTNYTYSWSNGGSLDDATSANPTAFPTETTTYTVMVQSFGSDTCMISQEVTVIVAPAIELTVSDDAITCGEDATLTSSTAVDVDVMWVNSQGGVEGNTPSIVVNPFTVETYTVTAEDAFGCSETQSVTVTDNGVDVDNSGDIETCQAQEVVLSVTNLDPDDMLTHTWSPATNIIGATDLAEVTVAVETGSMTFMNSISNQHGCTAVVPFTVEVVPFSVDMPAEVAICFGEPVGLSPDANPDYNYSWSPGDGLDNPNSSNPMFIGDEDQVYSVTITDNGNGIPCMTTREVAVDVSTPIELQADGDTTLCEIMEVTLNASSTQNGVGLEWFDGNGSMGTGSPLIVTPAEGNNTYMVVATDTENCSDTATVSVFVGLVDTGIEDLVSACEGAPTALNPGGNPDFIYTWSPEENLDLTNPWNPVVSTDTDQTYTVVITSADGTCVIEDTTTVAIYDAINLDVTGGGIACDSSTLTFTATSDIASEFSWADASGVGIFDGDVFTTVVTGSTFFTVTAEDENGCIETETVSVNDERISADITPDAVLCESISDYLIEVTNNIPTHELTYAWTPNLTEGSSILINPANNSTETYSVEVTNQFGCTTTLSSTVQVIDLADLLEITASPDTIRINESSELEVTGCDDCTYSWDWPSGTIDGEGNVITAMPDELFSNIYTVMVNQGACNAELDIEVFVRDALCDEPHIFLPNAFTPNNDGENDILLVRASFVESLQLMIYNRWGEEMFVTQSLDQGWDGTYKGEQLPPDVYGYYLLINCPNGEVFTKKGSITLLR